MWINVFALVADVNPAPGTPSEGAVVWALVISIAIVLGTLWTFIRISNRKEKEYRERRTREVD